MKKTLLVALAVLLGTVAFAQNKNERLVKENQKIVDLTAKDAIDNVTWGQIATPFVANDVYGNSVSLQSYLDSGKCVVIDYSCTWCGPCWNMHTSGLLEQIDALEDVQVIWVEIEGSNSVNQIFGPAGGSTYADYTYGNWTVTADGDSIEYPIIDDDANGTCLATCRSLYQGYVPTIFFITPDGYFCDLNIANDLIAYSDVEGSMANIQALLQRYPRAGQTPIVSIKGPAEAISGNQVNFSCNVLSIDDITGYSWTFEGGNPASASTASASTSWAAGGTYTVTLAVTNTSGTTTATTTVQVHECSAQALPFSCGFEASDNMDCWTFIDNDGDGYDWTTDFSSYFSDPTSMAHNGSGFVGSASYINGIGALSPDNWMITPELIIPAEGATLNYYIGAIDAQYYQEYYSILVSTTGTNPESFTGTIFAGANDAAAYTLKSFDLSSYAGQNIHIAFRHHNVSDVYWIKIDDLEVIAGQHAGISNVAEANVNLYPNPTTNVLNIVAEGVQEVRVIDINGRTAMVEKNANSIDMSNLANGVYYVRVITNNGISSQKVVKK